VAQTQEFFASLRWHQRSKTHCCFPKDKPRFCAVPAVKPQFERGKKHAFLHIHLSICP